MEILYWKTLKLDIFWSTQQVRRYDVLALFYDVKKWYYVISRHMSVLSKMSCFNVFQGKISNKTNISTFQSIPLPFTSLVNGVGILWNVEILVLFNIAHSKKDATIRYYGKSTYEIFGPPSWPIGGKKTPSKIKKNTSRFMSTVMTKIILKNHN